MQETFGRYQLLSRIGTGGMAEVWTAKSFGALGFEKLLVIKRILPELAQQPKFVDMFVHEAKLSVQLSHANIVQVFDLGKVDQKDGTPGYFMAMEYVAGLDLSSLLLRCHRQKISLPVPLCVYICSEIAKALDYAHRKRDGEGRPLGIVHRDISPQNILLSWEGDVKVTDFGIAKARDYAAGPGSQEMPAVNEGAAESVSDKAKPYAVSGKISYLSPEQSLNEPVDGRSDIFSLGIVFYEMLTGGHPFWAPSAAETVRRIRAGEFPPLELSNPDVPWPLVAIVHRMLAQKPQARFADAGHSHEELLGFFFGAGERVGAPHLSAFLERFRDEATAQPAAVLEERAGTEERTPVEIPQPFSLRGSTGSGTSDSPVSRARPSGEVGEQREVTALVLSFGPALRDATKVPADLKLRVCNTLQRHGAWVIEFEPTHATALFGLGDPDGQDAELAVRSAFTLLRGRGGLGASCGVYTGRILVDAGGAPIRNERLSAMLSGAETLSRAAEGQVAVSPMVARILRNSYVTQELPPAAGKDPKRRSHGVHIVVSMRSPLESGGRFIGRTDELKKLGELLTAAMSRTPQIAFVVGESGIGKTRLLTEMERRLSKGNYNVGFYMAACPRNGAGTPWSALTAMLLVLCGVQEGEDEERIRANVLPRLRALGLEDDTAAAVLTQLGVPLPGRAAGQGGLGSLLRSAFSQMLQRLSDDRLHCFVWDDAHTMDAATAEAILSLVKRRGAPGLRAMFLIATRDRLPGVLSSYEPAPRLVLGPLSENDSARLLANRMGARFVPNDVLAFCRERAGGHPLFLEELIRELLDAGAVSVLSGSVKARLDGAAVVPRTLRALIASRIGRLSQEERRVLQATAVLGEPILTDVLSTLVAMSVAQLSKHLAQLSARDLVRMTGPSQASFASPMHAEIVLDTLPPEQCKALHEAAAQAYLATLGEDADEHAERIAQHFCQAGDRDRAASFFARASQEKIRTRQLEPALRHLTLAMDLCDPDRRAPSELHQWLSMLADLASRVRLASDLPMLSKRLLRRLDAAGTVEQQVSARIFTAQALGNVNLFQDAFTLLDEAYAKADGAQRAKATAIEAEMAVRSGDYMRAGRAADLLLSMPVKLDMRALLAVAQVRAVQGKTADALQALDDAALLEGASDPLVAAEREKLRALSYMYARDFKAAADVSARVVDLARAAGLRYETAAALHNLGDASRRMGELPRAYAALSESLTLAESAGFERLASINRIHLSYLDGLVETPNALGNLERLILEAEARGYLNDALEGRFLLSMLRLHRGELLLARRGFEEVLASAMEFGNAPAAEDAHRALQSMR